MPTKRSADSSASQEGENTKRRGRRPWSGVQPGGPSPLARYFKWEWTPSDGFDLGCEDPKHPYQFAACTNDVGWNSLSKALVDAARIVADDPTVGEGSERGGAERGHVLPSCTRHSAPRRPRCTLEMQTFAALEVGRFEGDPFREKRSRRSDEGFT